MYTRFEDIETPEDGYVINCHVNPKDDQVGDMFRPSAKGVTAHLDGYAIIPMEEYEKLKASQVIPLSEAVADINAQISAAEK